MTKKKATEVLIQAAVNDIRGSGLGYRSTSDEWRTEVTTAIKIMWKHVNKREITESEKFNLGI